MGSNKSLTGSHLIAQALKLEEVFLSVHLLSPRSPSIVDMALRGPYNLIIAALLGQMKADRFAMELAIPYAGGIDVLRQFPQHKMLELGVVDQTDARVESSEQIAERAMEFVPIKRLTLNPDCGFALSSLNPMDFDEPYLKLSALSQGATLLRDWRG